MPYRDKKVVVSLCAFIALQSCNNKLGGRIVNNSHWTDWNHAAEMVKQVRHRSNWLVGEQQILQYHGAWFMWICWHRTSLAAYSSLLPKCLHMI
jgi:hypothetical protein